MDDRICGRCYRKVVRECHTCSTCYTAYHPSCYRIKNCCKSSNNSYSSFGQNSYIQYGYAGGFSTNIDQIFINSNAFSNRICGRCHKNVVRDCRNCTWCNTSYHPSCYELKNCCKEFTSSYNLLQRSADQFKSNVLISDTSKNLITFDTLSDRVCGRCHKNVVRECKNCPQCYKPYHPSCYEIKTCCKESSKNSNLGGKPGNKYDSVGLFADKKENSKASENLEIRICGRCHKNVVRECKNCPQCNKPYHPSCFEIKTCCKESTSTNSHLVYGQNSFGEIVKNLIQLEDLTNRICGRCHKNVVKECKNCLHCNTPYHPSCYELKRCCEDLTNLFKIEQKPSSQYNSALLSTDTKKNPITLDNCSERICGRCHKNVIRECKNCPQCYKPYHPSCYEIKTCCKEWAKNYNLGEKPGNKHDSVALFTNKKENSKDSEKRLEDRICERCHNNVVRECKECSQCKKPYHPSCYKIKTCCKNLNDDSSNDTKLVPKSNKNEESNRFNENSEWIQPKSEKHPFKVGLLNSRSIITKFPTIKELVKEQNLSVFGVTETWLKEHHKDSSISIEGYKHFRFDRHKHGGGLILYVKDGMKCKKINLPTDIDCSEVQQLWCEIEHENKTRAIGLIYRPPRVQYQKLNYIHDAIKKISSNYDDFTVMGDFNVHYLNEKKTREREVLRQLERDFNMTQLVEEPTRHDKNTASLLDHVYTNHPESWKCVANIENNFSDHNLIVFNSQH